jgi:hypothetical protein
MTFLYSSAVLGLKLEKLDQRRVYTHTKLAQSIAIEFAQWPLIGRQPDSPTPHIGRG